MPDVMSESFLADSEFEIPRLDTEPSNIISLAEEGLLLPSSTRLPADFIYHNYSPLNEW